MYPYGCDLVPRWVCHRTHMGVTSYQDGSASVPMWVCPGTRIGTPVYPCGSSRAPIWVCHCTHMDSRMHPNGFGLLPRWVRPRTQMGHRKDPPVFRAALGAGGPASTKGARARLPASFPGSSRLRRHFKRWRSGVPALLSESPRPAAQRPWSAPVLWSSGKPGWPGPGLLHDDTALPAEGAERRRGAALRERCARSGVRLCPSADLKAAGAGLTRPDRGRLRRTGSGHRCRRRAGGRSPRPWAAAAGSRAARAGSGPRAWPCDRPR